MPHKPLLESTLVYESTRPKDYELTNMREDPNLTMRSNGVPQSVRWLLPPRLYGTTLRALTDYESVSNIVTHCLGMSLSRVGLV